MPTRAVLESMSTPRSLRSLKAGISLGDVARGIGAHTTHISRIFNGRRTPSTAMAKRIANFLGITTDELFAALDEASATTPRARAA